MTRAGRFTCADCGADTRPGRRGGGNEYYMVHNTLWEAAGMGAGKLCIGCLEERLGRRLTPPDFTKCRVNEPRDGDSPRLAERKGHR